MTANDGWISKCYVIQLLMVFLYFLIKYEHSQMISLSANIPVNSWKFRIEGLTWRSKMIKYVHTAYTLSLGWAVHEAKENNQRTGVS